MPTRTPLFTDQGYPWLWGIYRNHRSVNHSARSKDNRFRFARNRWSKNGVHNQVAEGNHRVLKTAFASYGYITPKYSQLYLNEFSFIKNANVFGLDVLVESVSGDDSCLSRDAFLSGTRATEQGAVRKERKGFVRKIQSKRTENWLQISLSENSYKVQPLESVPKILSHTGYGILNPLDIIEKETKRNKKELLSYNRFWQENNIKRFQRNRELEYQKISQKIWHFVQHEKTKGNQCSVNQICEELSLHKHTATTILNRWLKLKLIVRRRVGYNYYDRRINFYIKILKKDLPLILYTKFRKYKKPSSRVSNNEI